MDQIKAQKLFDYGATLIFIDVPEGTEFGIDSNAWSVGPKFKGVKMIPPGVHFIYFSPVSRVCADNGCGDIGHRSGFFYDFQPKEVVVRLWNRETETMSDAMVCEDDRKRIEGNKKEFDQFLAPYPYENHRKWISLSNHVSGRIVQQVSPDCGIISSFSEVVAEDQFKQKNVHRKNKMGMEEEVITSQEQMMDESQQDIDSKNVSSNTGSVDEPTSSYVAECQLPKMKQLEKGRMRFHTIPRHAFPFGASPSDVTRMSIDKTTLLEDVLRKEFQSSNKDLLAELQISFVTFIYGRLFEGFEQWKHLVGLICSSSQSATNHIQLYNDFITVIYFQVQEIPSDFFVDIVTCNNFLTSTLCSLFIHLRQAEVEGYLKSKAQKFQQYLTKRFKWNFEEDDLDDEKPVIVELSEDQMKMIQ